MRLHEAFSSPSLYDIIYSCNDRAAGDDMKPSPLGKGRKYKPVDRSLQGAALSQQAQKVVVTNTAPVVESSGPAPMEVPTHNAPLAPKDTTMQLTLKGLNAKGTTAIYAGALGSVRIGLAAFPGKTAPEAIEVADGVFAVKAPKVAKVKLTKEERALLPKPTEAEKIARMEQRLAEAKAKLAQADSDI